MLVRLRQSRPNLQANVDQRSVIGPDSTASDMSPLCGPKVIAFSDTFAVIALVLVLAAIATALTGKESQLCSRRSLAAREPTKASTMFERPLPFSTAFGR